MAFTPEQQAQELIKRAQKTLLIAHPLADIDTLCALFAMAQTLRQMQKAYDTVILKWTDARWPGFLPKEEIRPQLGALRSFHIEIDVEKTPLAELLYEVREGKLDITLVPKHSEWSEQDLKTIQGRDQYDLAIAFSILDRESLLSLFPKQTDFFHRVPVINIDHLTDNPSWGHVNMIDITASSTTEVLYRWFERWNPMWKQPMIATALLGGIMSASRGYQSIRLSPETLKASAHLMDLGADRQSIANHLWKIRSVQTLKLWGRVLSRLSQDRTTGLVWSTLDESDLLECQASLEDLQSVIEELLTASSEAQVVAFFVSLQNTIHLHLFARPPHSAMDLGRQYGLQGTRNFVSGIYREQASFVETVPAVVEELKKRLASNQ